MAEPSSTSNSMTLDVLSILNESRMTYGLRHEDYERYRQYCTNRVRRLRQILKLTQPNTKSGHATKPLPEQFTDSRYLQLYLFETERAWGYAMELKQESANSMDTRHRHHLVKRLKRAAQHSETLFSLCEKQNVDNRTVLDVKAYASLMKGYLLFEQQQWKEALNNFAESRTIYETFGKSESNAEQEALCYSAIDLIDPNIRFCAYKLQLNDGIEGLVNQHQGDSLKAQLAKIKKTKQDAQSSLTWRNKEIDIKNHTLAQAVVKAQETHLDQQEKDVVAAYDKVLGVWADAEKIAKKAIKEDKEATAKITSSKSAKATEDLNHVFTYVDYNLFGYSIKRNLCLVDQVQKKPQQAIKLYDDILKNVEYIWELPTVKDDMAFDGELNVLSLYYKGCRCFQVALAYNDMKKTAESLALYQRSQTYVVQAKQGLSQIRSFNEDALLKVTEGDLSELESSIRAGSWKARAAWYLENGSEEQEISQHVDLENTDVLLNHLDTYPSTISEKHLVDFPPKFQPVAVKPFYFDLAANFVKYPEDALNERTNKSSGGGGFWGLFGRK